MKWFYLLFICALFLSSCKKNKDEFIFLKGKLVGDCIGTPLPDEKIYLYQDYSGGFASTGFLEIEEEELEIATTDSEGKFTFNGRRYTNSDTESINPASIRLADGTVIAQGILGRGKGVNSAPLPVQDVGNLYVNNFEVSFNLKISNHSATNIYFDSVQVDWPLNSMNQMLTILDGEWFSTATTINQGTLKKFRVEDNGAGTYQSIGGYIYDNLHLEFYDEGVIAKSITYAIKYEDCLDGLNFFVLYD